MKKILSLIVAIMALISTGCQNDGDIGFMFGTWRVESYTADGTAVSLERYPTTFSFQGSVVKVQVIEDEYGSNNATYGNWSRDESAGTVTLNFGNSDDKYGPGEGPYAAPEYLGMTSAAPMVMQLAHDGRTMTWTWHAPDGVVRIYKLHKTW